MTKEILPERVQGAVWIYAMQAGDVDVYKIGQAVDLARRIARIRPKKAYGVRFSFAFLVPAAAAHAEQISQYRLEEYALRGDWFLVSRHFLFQTMQGIIVDQLRVTNHRVWLVGQ